MHWAELDKFFPLEKFDGEIEETFPGHANYYRRDDISPMFSGEKLILVSGKGIYRSWGTPRLESEAYYLKVSFPKIVAIRVRWFTKHFPASTVFFFLKTETGWERVTKSHRAIHSAFRFILAEKALYGR